MSTPIEAAPAPIASDLSCMKCSYNLRTLSPTALCPECATPVIDSLDHHDQFSDIHFGRIILATILLIIAGSISRAFYASKNGMLVSSNIPAMLLGFTVPAAIMLWSLWLFARCKPIRAKRTLLFLYLAYPVALLLVGAASLLDNILIAAHPEWIFLHPTLWGCLYLPYPLVALALAISYFVGIGFMRDLARRLRAPWLLSLATLALSIAVLASLLNFLQLALSIPQYFQFSSEFWLNINHWLRLDYPDTAWPRALMAVTRVADSFQFLGELLFWPALIVVAIRRRKYPPPNPPIHLFTETPQPLPSLPAPDTVIAQDIPCMRCGYNLRTLAAGARCPECSTSILATLEHHARACGYRFRQIQLGFILLSFVPPLGILGLGLFMWRPRAIFHRMWASFPIAALLCFLVCAATALLATAIRRPPFRQRLRGIAALLLAAGMLACLNRIWIALPWSLDDWYYHLRPTSPLLLLFQGVSLLFALYVFTTNYARITHSPSGVRTARWLLMPSLVLLAIVSLRCTLDIFYYNVETAALLSQLLRFKLLGYPDALWPLLAGAALLMLQAYVLMALSFISRSRRLATRPPIPRR